MENDAQREEAIVSFLDTPEAIEILKWMCFQLGRMAHIFAEDGENIPAKAEEEQSFMLRKMLKHAAKHGADWRKFAADELEAAHKRVIAARAQAAKCARR